MRLRPALYLYAIAVATPLLIAPATTTYWDAFGYLTQGITGEVGGLGLGRPVFVLAVHAIARAWLGAGGSPWHVEALLRTCVIAASATSAPVTYRLACACGLRARAAWIAGLAVACSPALAHVSGQVLTDGPALACLLAALVCGVRASAPEQPRAAATRLALASGAAFGLAIGIREQAIVYALALALVVWRAPSRARARLATAMGVGAVACALAPLVFVLATQPGYLDTIRHWLDGIRADRALKTYGWRDLAIYVVWLLSLGPVIVFAAVRHLASRLLNVRGARAPLAAIVLASVVQLAWMATLRGVGYSPRFLVQALPGAIALPGAMAIDRWIGRSHGRLIAATLAIALPVLVAAPIVRARSAPLERTLRTWPSMLTGIPGGAVIVSGQPCPAVPLVEALLAHDRAWAGRVPSWEPICPGWGWPRDLPSVLDRALADGRLVALDVRPASWIGAEQRAALADAERYARARAGDTARGRVIVWRAESTSPPE